MSSLTTNIRTYFLNLQQNICQQLGEFEKNQHFLKDEWQRELGGGGITMVLEQGEIFEKGGVNFSHVYGQHMPASSTAHRQELAQSPFEAMGVSLVIHPRNPYIPTSHMNVRYFQSEQPDGSTVWWFGGGYDLTPYYGFTEDCVHWHQTAYDACQPFGEDVYPEFKQWCDDYFYLTHRQEPRGIGGIFFDDLNRWPVETCFDFIRSVGDSYLQAYCPIIERRMETPYGERERNFQLYRRGRYVEFNLVCDRGTLFGLQSKGRTESILMSLPNEVHYKYNWRPDSNSAEAELTDRYLVAKNWL